MNKVKTYLVVIFSLVQLTMAVRPSFKVSTTRTSRASFFFLWQHLKSLALQALLCTYSCHLPNGSYCSSSYALLTDSVRVSILDP